MFKAILGLEKEFRELASIKWWQVFLMQRRLCRLSHQIADVRREYDAFHKESKEAIQDHLYNSVPLDRHGDECECKNCNTPFYFFSGLTMNQKKKQDREIFNAYKK